LAGVPCQVIKDHALAAVQFGLTNSDVVDEIASPIDELRYWKEPEVNFFNQYASIVMPSVFGFWAYQPGHYDAVTLAQQKADFTIVGCYSVNESDRLARSAKQFRQILQAAHVL